MSKDKYPYQQDDHYRFAFVADEWLTEYAFQSGGVVSLPVLTFSFAMTLELYLKAYYSKISSDGLGATKFGHRIDKLLSELQKNDLNFPDILKFNLKLINYPLYELDRNSWNTDWLNRMSEDDKKDLKNNYEFYLIMAYGADLKYGISPSLEKHNGRIISSAWTHFNPKLAEIVIKIRSIIGYPGYKKNDNLTYAIQNNRQTQKSIDYISNIILQTVYLD